MKNTDTLMDVKADGREQPLAPTLFLTLIPQVAHHIPSLLKDRFFSTSVVFH